MRAKSSVGMGVAVVCAGLLLTCELFTPAVPVDYVVSAPNFPDTGYATGPIEGDFTIDNQGTETGTALVSWTLYISSDSSLDAADTVAAQGSADPLASGASTDAIALSGTWPASGAFYLILVLSALDDGALDNNSTVSDAVSVLAAPAPDYEISATTYPSGGPTLGGFAGDFTISNSGNLDGGATIGWTVYVSADTTLDVGDTTADTGVEAALNVGADSGAINFSGNWPVPPGDKYVIIAITATDDADTGNNSATSTAVTVTQANRFVAVGFNASVWYSDDLGLSWTAGDTTGVISGEGTSLTEIALDPNTMRLVAVGTAGGSYYSDDLGETWVATASGTGNNLQGMDWGDYSGGRFVAASEGGTGQTIYSGDGINWTIGGTTSVPNYSVAYTGSNFVAGNNTGSSIRYSSDGGANWTAASGLLNGTQEVLQGASNLIIVGYDGSSEAFGYSADDGLNTSSATAPGLIDSVVQARAYDGEDPSEDLLVAISGGSRVWTSVDDGLNWGVDATGTPNAAVYGLAYGGTVWVGVGDPAGDGNVWYSLDDTNTWTPTDAGSEVLYDVVFIP